MPGLWEATLRIGEGSAKPIANVGLPPMEYLLAWRMASRKICSAAKKSGLLKLPNGSATVRPVPTALHSAAMSACRLAATHEKRRPERHVRFWHEAKLNK